MVKQWKREGRTVDHLRVEQLLMVEQSNRDGGSVEQEWWNNETSDRETKEHLMVEQWNI